MKFKKWVESEDSDFWKSGTEHEVTGYKGMTVAEVAQAFNLEEEYGWTPEWIMYYFQSHRDNIPRPNQAGKYNRFKDNFMAISPNNPEEEYDLDYNPQKFSKPVGFFWLGFKSHNLKGNFPSQEAAISYAINQGYKVRRD